MARNRVDDYYDYIDGKRENDTFYKSINKNFCIFISHKHEDEQAAKKIADYIITKADIDVYLDQKDTGLQGAVKKSDDKLIVKYIERGIHESTHILCLVSDKTKESWWVPYEIGYAKMAQKKISSLKLKNVKEIPSYLKIEEIFNGIASLNLYLNGIQNNWGELELSTKYFHPLRDYLD